MISQLNKQIKTLYVELQYLFDLKEAAAVAHISDSDCDRSVIIISDLYFICDVPEFVSIFLSFQNHA